MPGLQQRFGCQTDAEVYRVQVLQARKVHQPSIHRQASTKHQEEIF